MFAKIEWYKDHVVKAPYGVTMPGDLMEVWFMVKDSKRFPQTNGWGYATIRVRRSHRHVQGVRRRGPDFHKTACHGCHTIVKSRDFLFTNYPKR